MQCHLHFLFLIFPIFPIAARKYRIQLPFSFLLPQSLSVLAVWVAPNQLAGKSIHVTAGQSGKGEVEAGANPSPGEQFLGKLQAALSAPARSEGLKASLLGRPSLQEGRKRWGPHPQLLLCSSGTVKHGPAFIR